MSYKKNQKFTGYYQTSPGSVRMTSLCPGPLFKSPGLNNYSTPSSRTDTPAEINSRFSRIPFNSVPWPKASPVSKVYDVRNSSTSMILLNNKYSRKGCRLRGQTLNDGDVKGPDPDRHLSETPHVNRRSHMDCGDSSSPVFKPEKKTGLRWCNSSQRPPIKFEDGSSVNYKRHTTCMVSDDLRTMNWRRPQRPYSTSIIRESMRSRSPLLEDLNPGERLYMYSIARVYSVDKMRKQKQSQYCHLLHREVERGIYSPEECERYWRYLNRPRKTQQGPDDGFQRRRAKSAPGRRSDDRQNDRAMDISESGRQSEASRSLRSKSRGSSRPVSRASVASSRYYKKKSNDQNGHSDVKQDDTSNNQSPKKTSNSQTPKKSLNPQTTKNSFDSQTPKKSKPKYQSVEESKEQDPGKRIPVESDEDEDAQYEAQVRGLDRVRDSESSDSDVPTRELRHREGKDRPKSRLGGRKKDAVRKKDTSDDDYSSDSSDSSSDESHTDRTTSQSKSTSEPTSKMSQSNQNKEAQPGKAKETKEAKPKGDSQADNKQDSSYSEDFTETSASQSVSHSKGDKSDMTESKGDNSATKQSDSSESQTISQSVSTSQSKTPSSDQTTLGSTKDQTETSTSVKAEDSSTMKSTEQTTESNDAALKSSSDDGSKAEKRNETMATEKDKVKVTDEVRDEGKATDDVQKEAKTDKEEVRVADESYSDDFTESKSEESKKPAEISTRPDHADKDGRAVAEGEKGTESSTNQRRDSIELESDERVRDWDKIEY